MFKGTLRILLSVCTAAMLTLTLAACGGDTPEPPKEETPKTEEPAKTEAAPEEVSYKCAKCAKTAKLAAGKAAPD